MTIYCHAVVTIAKTSLLPADSVQNTFNFILEDDGLAIEGRDSLLDMIDFFYNGLAGDQVQPINHWLSESLIRTGEGCKVDLFEVTPYLDGSPHGPPIWSMPFTLEGSGGNALPAEMAVVGSYHASYVGAVEFGAGGTRPRARERGRVYLGPLSIEVLSGSGEVTVADNVCVDVINALVGMMTTPARQLAVWSRKNARMDPATTAWCDNAFDVQRRRGIEATNRFTLSP